MGVSVAYGEDGKLEFSAGEFAGAVGDSVTVLPVVVALAALTDLPLGRLLVGFGVFQIVWGLYYGLPISVEPMKALAALVIAGGLTVFELAAAGLIAGVVLFAVGVTGTLSRFERHVGQPVVRGVQLSVALLLLDAGAGLALERVPLAAISGGVVLLAIAQGYRRAAPLVVLGLGVGLAAAETGVPAIRLPAIAPGAMATSAAFTANALDATAAQVAMTVGNAAVATSLLLEDFFDADVSADELATSMGAMNLVAVPLGAIPMCHGSGGVAGKYAFGARGPGANVILGLLYVGAAVAAADIVAAFPMAMLGVLLVLVAVELGRAGLRTDRLLVTVGVGALGAVANLGVAFAVGIAVDRVLRD